MLGAERQMQHGDDDDDGNHRAARRLADLMFDEGQLMDDAERRRHVHLVLHELGLLELDDGTLPPHFFLDVEPPDRRPAQTCQVCLETLPLDVRPCCRLPVCDECMRNHVETQLVDAGVVRIACPGAACDRLVYQDDVRRLLRANDALRERYDRWLVNLNAAGDGDAAGRKTCPRCCLVTDVDAAAALRDGKTAKWGLPVVCVECQLEWCFRCQAPWHVGMTCKKFRVGDELLRNWAQARDRGQQNAHRCPKCKVYIQRTSGCDHMQCSQCHTKFCYRCGETRRGFKVLGFKLEHHDMKHSIVGCKEKYKPDRPVQRVLGRSAIFGAKLVGGIVAAPIALGLAAGLVGVAAVALPVYGCYRLVQRRRQHRRRSIERRFGYYDDASVDFGEFAEADIDVHDVTRSRRQMRLNTVHTSRLYRTGLNVVPSGSAAARRPPPTPVVRRSSAVESHRVRTIADADGGGSAAAASRVRLRRRHSF